MSLAWCFTDTTAGKRKKPTTRFCPNPLHNHNATPVDIPTESVFQDFSRGMMFFLGFLEKNLGSRKKIEYKITLLRVIPTMTFIDLLLANLLAFYLTYLLAFDPAFYLAYLLAYILVYLLACLLAFYLAYLLADVLAYLLAFYLAYLLAYYLANLLGFYLAYLVAVYLIEGSLEVKLPTIWTDEKQSREEAERRERLEERRVEEKELEERKIRRNKSRRERVRRKKMQMREKVGKSRNTVFFQ